MRGNKCVRCASVSCLLLLLVAFCNAQRFMSQRGASQFLIRRRRANSLFEERMKGNLERECIEELCNTEEAREIFENNPETDYFYPRYVACLGSYRVGISNNPTSDLGVPSDLRTCVKEITNQCIPLPCYKEGYEKCIDGQASFRCVCKPGWRGEKCDEDIDECFDVESPAGCNQKCYNYPGSFRCLCEDGFLLSPDRITCRDINECILYPSICGPAQCVNTQGMYQCKCSEGYKYNFTSKLCDDVDECAEGMCSWRCVNTLGNYSCHCNGPAGYRLAADAKSCEEIPICVPLKDHKNAEMLYLGEQFIGLPVLYLRYRLPENTKFAAEFDFRTFDPEGVILYAESSQNSSWFMLGLRNGQIEIQYRNENAFKYTTGGKAVNDGQWHVISVDELEKSISVKISKEAVMNINSPDSLFTSVNGILETKVYIAGLPRNTDGLIKPINPRLDGCIRGWNLMNQGASGVKEVIQEKESKHCFVEVERGSYFPGSGLAQFDIDYSESMEIASNWTVNVKLNIRPSTGTGVLFSLVSNNTVPLSLVVLSSSDDEADIVVFIESKQVAKLQSRKLCYPGRLQLELNVSSSEMTLSADSSTGVLYADSPVLHEQLTVLDAAMNQHIHTYVGGVPDVPLTATPVTAYYNGCLEIVVNGMKLDFDEAIRKDNRIKSHSCPPV